MWIYGPLLKADLPVEKYVSGLVEAAESGNPGDIHNELTKDDMV